MTIAWTRGALSPEAQRWALRFNALIEAGIDRNDAALSSPQTVVIQLFGTSASDVVGKIQHPEVLHNNPLVRAILDQRLGAAHAPDEPLGSGNDSVLILTTIQPHLAVKSLQGIPQVASVRLG